MRKALPWILVLIIIILMIKPSLSPIKQRIETKIRMKDSLVLRTINKYTTYVDTQIVYQKKDLIKYKVIPCTTYVDLDTTEVIKDYFLKRVYSDTIHLAEGFILIKDTIQKNSLSSRLIRLNIKKDSVVPEFVVEDKVSKHKKSFLIGPSIGVINGKGVSYGLGGGILQDRHYYGVEVFNNGLMINYKFKF